MSQTYKHAFQLSADANETLLYKIHMNMNQIEIVNKNTYHRSALSRRLGVPGYGFRIF